jgi:endonuclease I
MRLASVIVAVVVAGCAATDDRAPGGPGGGKTDDGTQGDGLREKLHAEVADHVALSYFDARNAMFNTIDVHDDLIESVYTGLRVAPDGSNTPGGFNTEHVWPQSQGAEEEPPRSDLHHIFPVDAESNSARASHPFGEIECNDAGQVASVCAWQADGSALEVAEDKITGTFEVRAARRGDVARAKFYFAIRYELPIDDDQETVLRAWHAEDPPDDVERERDEAIAELQHNHNPFVVDPDLVDELVDF